LLTACMMTEVDAGSRPGTTTNNAEKLAQLERDNRELRRANAILRSASTFFAAERAALPICFTTLIDAGQPRAGVSGRRERLPARGRRRDPRTPRGRCLASCGGLADNVREPFEDADHAHGWLPVGYDPDAFDTAEATTAMRVWACGEHLAWHGVPEPLANVVQRLHGRGVVGGDYLADGLGSAAGRRPGRGALCRAAVAGSVGCTWDRGRG